jgi:hypothetical protein
LRHCTITDEQDFVSEFQHGKFISAQHSVRKFFAIQEFIENMPSPVAEPGICLCHEKLSTVYGSVLICHGARIALNPQRLDWSKMLRVGTTRGPTFNLKFKLRHCPIYTTTPETGGG